jgi:stearoyl-CoA desaturase (delta-9 desaturase)
MMSRIPFHKVNWKTSAFLIGTFILALTATPAYIWHFGLDRFQIALFFLMAAATGFSITLGYHRLFSHITFQAHWAVRLFTVLFGAAAFENSVLLWCSEHRRHHKHVDHEDDPYDISKGFFHAHIGWLLFKIDPDPPFDNVADLERDPLLRWQNKYIHWIALFMSFVLPALLGYAWSGARGALGGFLIGGIARVVAVQHSTFCINSMCHTVGRRPYSTRCSARDSWIMALFTFGEGYHNYHHEFQHDYRNGVKPWQFDPTKWSIWLLHKLGLASRLRTVPSERILLAELAEAQRQLQVKLDMPHLPTETHGVIQATYERLQQTAREWANHRAEDLEVTREMVAELKSDLREALNSLRVADRFSFSAS